MGVAGLIGLVEWIIVCDLGLGWTSDAAQRTLLTLGLVYGAFGLLLGLVCACLRAGDKRPALAIALPAAILVTGAGVLRAEGRGLLLAAGALALGWLGYRALRACVARFPNLLGARTLWSVDAVLLLALFVVASLPAPDGVSRALVIGASVAAVLLLFIGLRRLSERPWAQSLAVLVLLGACAVLGTRTPRVPTDAPPPADGPGVLLVTIDTLRADHVGAYGYAAARTPNLDALAREGTLFRQTVSQNVFTGPSHASILSGLYPRHHGVLLNEVKIPASITTLPDSLRNAGYATGCVVGGYTTLDSALGLPSRFNWFDDDLRRFHWVPVEAFDLTLMRPVMHLLERFGAEVKLRWPNYRRAADVTDVAIEWLEHNGGRPFFLWVHYFDPHLPYRPPERYLTEEDKQYDGPVTGRYFELEAAQRAKIIANPESVKHMVALYDASVAYVDDQLGRLLAAARAAAPEAGLMSVVTADHGESMGDHGLYWNRDLYDTVLLVPLVVQTPPGFAQLVPEVSQQVRLIDVTPTILDVLGVPFPPEGLDGKSLVQLMCGSPEGEPRPAHSGVYRYSDAFHRLTLSVRDHGWKLIWRPPGWVGGSLGGWAPEAHELYDLTQDPNEEHDLFSLAPQILSTLKEELESFKPPLGPVRVDMTPEERAKLKGLGYTGH